jgi:hypothetical protein
MIKIKGEENKLRYILEQNKKKYKKPKIFK